MSYELPTLDATLSFLAAFTAIVLAMAVAVKDRHSFTNRVFIASLALMALQELFRGLSFQALIPQDFLYWQQARVAVTALIPGTWLLFSLSLARPDYQDLLRRWRWIVLGAFALPAAIAVFFRASFFPEIPSPDPGLHSILQLGYAGKAFYLLLLLASVLILFNLERTLRASTGHIRWQIKFVILGLGGICLAWLYSASQVLLFGYLDRSLGLIHPVALLLANGLFVWGLARSRFLNVNVYLSRATIQYSLTVLLSGLYLIFVGLLAQLLHFISPAWSLQINALLVLLALVGLTLLLLSDRIQGRIRRLITRHFKRPQYDYRRAWMQLTERTASVTDVQELCTEVARVIGETLHFLSVTVWLHADPEPRLAMGGSTAFSGHQAGELARSGDKVTELLAALKDRSEPIDLTRERSAWAEDISAARPEYFSQYPMRYIFPVRSGGRLAAVMTFNSDRVGFAPLSTEDLDLVNAFTIQLATGIQQIRLSEQMRQAKELEAFQSLSTFFIHDMKNLVSRLALTMQNLPVHFENPEFRADVVRTLEQSVTQINEMCGSLSQLRQSGELRLVRTALHELVAETLNSLSGCAEVPLEKDLCPVPPALLDREKIQKVLVNLLLNAIGALNGKGLVRVAVGRQGERIFFSVSDNGCGMSAEFVEKSLFKPFTTTKKRGMGIGLFHAKMMVEAHRGWIEVQSREGEGSTFRVWLPL